MKAFRAKITKDNVAQVKKSIAALTNQHVLVGVPAEKADRDVDSDGKTPPINNAALAYIHNNGAPEAGIPARPHLVPGVKRVQENTIRRLRAAAVAAMDGGKQEVVDSNLGAAGMAAVTAVKQVLSENVPPPLQPETIKNRFRQRATVTRRKGEEQYLDLVGRGKDPGIAQADAGIVALVNTGAFRNAYTYVIRKYKR